MKLLIVGPPGSGKGTYASRLATQLKIKHIAMGELFREFVKSKPRSKLAKKIKQYMAQGTLVPDQLVFRLLQQELKNKDGWILDGFPRTQAQAKALTAMTDIDAVIALEVPLTVIIERLASRRQCSQCSMIYNLKTLKPKKENTCDSCGGTLYQREDDKPATIKKRFQLYNKTTKPILKQFKDKLIKIRNSKADIPPELIVAQILKALLKD